MSEVKKLSKEEKAAKVWSQMSLDGKVEVLGANIIKLRKEVSAIHAAINRLSNRK